MTRNFFGGIQWAVFLLASSIAAPVAIASVFGMTGLETALFLQRTVFVLGLACLTQALFGHRMPINEGPAGLWWGIFIVYAGLAGILYPSSADALQALQSGMIYSGVLFILLAVSGLAGKMKELFTPAITFVYLLLLVLQISESIINGMLGIVSDGDPVSIPIIGASVAIVLLMFYLSSHRIGWINRYSVLFAIGAGWLLFILMGEAAPVHFSEAPFITFPEMFVFGPIIWDSGMFVTSLFLTVLLMANMLASIRVMELLMKNTFKIDKPLRIKGASAASGINHLLAGIFSSIGPVPISGAAGFVAATRAVSLAPFIIGGIIVVLISLFPDLMAVLAALPAPVAYAVIFVIFSKMTEMAFRELTMSEDRERAYKIAAYGLIAGVGIMFVSPESMGELPAAAAATLSNGLIVGTLTSIVVEQIWLWRDRVKAKNTHK